MMKLLPPLARTDSQYENKERTHATLSALHTHTHTQVELCLCRSTAMVFNIASLGCSVAVFGVRAISCCQSARQLRALISF